MVKILKKYLSFLFRRIFNEEIQKELILKAKLISHKNLSFKKIKNLSNVEFQVFSQWGEDGIIDWLVNKFREIPKSFLEIGTENYKESNTRFLLINNNWDGFIIEADKSSVQDIKSQKVYWKYNLTVENEFVSQDNINKIIKRINVPKKLGILSLDIDGVDYWILKKMSSLEPSIIICEYNSLFGQKKAITVPYKKNYIRSNEHYSNLFYGASIKAFIDLLIDDCYGIQKLKTKGEVIESILDIGANVGLFGLSARIAYPKSRIHCYEPNSNLESFEI